MKKLIFLTLFILLSVVGYSQVPTPISVGNLTTNVCLGTVKVYGDQPIDPAANYTFSVTGGETINLITSGDQAEITWDIAGTYVVTLTKTLNGCITTMSTTVNVTNSSSGTITPQTVCEGSGLTPLAGVNLGTGVTYSGVGVSGTDFDAIGLAPGTYNITSTGTDAQGCPVNSTGTITITPLPTIILNSN
jgi:hypothetical protein